MSTLNFLWRQYRYGRLPTVTAGATEMQNTDDLMQRAQTVLRTVQKNQLRKYRVDREACDAIMELTYQEMVALDRATKGFAVQPEHIVRELRSWFNANNKDRSARFRAPASFIVECLQTPKASPEPKPLVSIREWERSQYYFCKPHTVHGGVFASEEWSNFLGSLTASSNTKVDLLDPTGLGSLIRCEVHFTKSAYSALSRRRLYFNKDVDGCFGWTKDATKYRNNLPAAIIRLPEFHLSLIVGATKRYGELRVIAARTMFREDQIFRQEGTHDAPLAEELSAIFRYAPKLQLELTRDDGEVFLVDLDTMGDFGFNWGADDIHLAADRDLFPCLPCRITVPAMGLSLYGKGQINKYNRWSFAINSAATQLWVP